MHPVLCQLWVMVRLFSGMFTIILRKVTVRISRWTMSEVNFIYFWKEWKMVREERPQSPEEPQEVALEETQDTETEENQEPRFEAPDETSWEDSEETPTETEESWYLFVLQRESDKYLAPSFIWYSPGSVIIISDVTVPIM